MARWTVFPLTILLLCVFAGYQFFFVCSFFANKPIEIWIKVPSCFARVSLVAFFSLQIVTTLCQGTFHWHSSCGLLRQSNNEYTSEHVSVKNWALRHTCVTIQITSNHWEICCVTCIKIRKGGSAPCPGLQSRITSALVVYRSLHYRFSVTK